MEKKNDLAKNTLLLSLGTFFTKGMSFVMVPIFSRWLTTSDYGIYDLLSTYVMLILPIIGLASNEALFRFSMDTDSREEKTQYVSNCFAIFSINSLIFLLIVIALKCVAGWNLALYFFILAIGEIYNLHLRGFLRAIKHLDIYSYASVCTTVLIAVFTTIFIKGFGMGLEGILLGYGCGYIAGDIFIVICAKYWKFFSLKKISIIGMKKLVRYSYALIPNSLAWWFINVSDRTIINMFLGAEYNGVYALAYKIPNILTSIFSVFGVSWQQSATEMLNDKNRNEYYNRIYNKMVTILLSLCCCVLSMNSWLFNYIFDERYYEGHFFTPILIGGTLFAGISQFYGSIQISFKQPKENGISTVIGAISNLVIHMGLIGFIGLYAAALSTLLSQIIVMLTRHFRLKKVMQIKWSKTTKLMVLMYIYFTIMAYCISNFYINILNTVIAVCFMLLMNKEFIHKAFQKVLKRK